MKQLLLTILTFFFSGAFVLAQTPPPPGGPDDSFTTPGNLPLDTNIFILLLVALTLVAVGSFISNSKTRKSSL